VKEARGSRDEVESIVLAAVDEDLRLVSGSETEVACDTVCLAVGLVPSVELLQVLGCRLVFRPDRGGVVPESDGRLCTSVADVFVAGDCAGLGATSIADPGRAVRQGRRAGLAAAASLGATAPDQRDELPADSSADHGSLAPSYEYWRTWLRVSL